VIAEDDFTEAGYRTLLRVARGRYPFVRFADHARCESGVLWRHDVDVSPHRALALARIERDEGVRATYFVHLHSMFYNALELEALERFREIAALGHDIGLHFDSHVHRAAMAATSVESAVRFEADILREMIGVAPLAVSFHNPDLDEELSADQFGGLVNAYGRAIRERFAYCSDSNGYWRHTPIAAALQGDAPRLHVLTHPEWWPADAMLPRQRILRAVEGRARSAVRSYEAQLDATGRSDAGGGSPPQE
jgi:peptidoglycan/xylan/chitin deacetylase (PgdA/CDA1 family)